MISDMEIALRLIFSVVLGGVIGFEREKQKKIAGLRTHSLVCLGSCLVTILSINLYAGVQGLTNADPARLAAQVVSGIGFLGAGAIMKEGPTIVGLTTAAGLWVVASVGIAVGAGCISGAIITTVLVMMILFLLPKFEKMVNTRDLAVQIVIRVIDRPGQIGRIGSYLEAQGARIIDMNIHELENGEVEIPVTLVLSDKRRLEHTISGLKEMEDILSVKKY